MTFDEKFPDAVPGDMPANTSAPPQSNDWGTLLGTEQLPCWHCSTPTSWLNVSFDAPLCSEECTTAKWAEYEEAAANSARKQ